VFILEICALLGNFAEYRGNSLPTFRDNLSVPSSRGEISLSWRWWQSFWKRKWD